MIAFNRQVDLAAAKEITSTFVGGRHCAGVCRRCLGELKRKKDIRLLDVGPLSKALPLKGYDLKKLVEADRAGSGPGVIWDIKALAVPTARKPTEEEYAACAFAWVGVNTREVERHHLWASRRNRGYRCRAR